MPGLVHIDEIDNDQATHVAQPELAGNLVSGLAIRLDRRLLDIAFPGRAAGIDVDRHQRFGLVDDDITA